MIIGFIAGLPWIVTGIVLSFSKANQWQCEQRGFEQTWDTEHRIFECNPSPNEKKYTDN